MEGDEKDATGPAIVVVDDTTFFRHLLSDLLEGRGYRVIALPAGDEIADLLGRTEVAVVLSDIEMPGMDGLTLCRKIREDLGLKRLPVLMFSSLINEQMAHKCDLVGATGYIGKPQIPALIEMIDGHCLK